MTGLLAEPYSLNRASYDLTRLRRNGLIVRVAGRNTYRLTPDGLAFPGTTSRPPRSRRSAPAMHWMSRSRFTLLASH
jgi:hypothetical protein